MRLKLVALSASARRVPGQHTKQVPREKASAPMKLRTYVRREL